jgi:DNA polymerase-3 subunit delta'
LGPAWGISSEQAGLLAQLSGGRPGIARRLLDEPETAEAREEVLESHVRMIPENRLARFHFAETAAKDKEALRSSLEVWGAYWRDVLIVTTGANTPLIHLDREGEIREVAGQTGAETARRTLAAIERTRDRIDRNANTRLALETLMLELPRLRVK